MGRHKPTSADLVEEFKARYRELWSERYGGPCMTRLSMTDRRNVKDIVETLGVGEAFGRLKRYFADRSPWLTERAHPLRVFLAQVDQYRSKKNGKKKIARAGKGFDERWGI